MNIELTTPMAIFQPDVAISKVLLCGSMEPCGETYVQLRDGSDEHLKNGLAEDVLSSIVANHGAAVMAMGRCRKHGPNAYYNAIPPRSEADEVKQQTSRKF